MAKQPLRIRRVTLYRDTEGRWRFHAAAYNWKIIRASEQSFARKETARARIVAEFGNAVEVVEGL